MHRAPQDPYDRVIVTARSDDVTEAWWQALRDGARLVVPLRLEGVGEYAVGFARRGDRLESAGAYPCAFIALRREADDSRPASSIATPLRARAAHACARSAR